MGRATEISDILRGAESIEGIPALADELTAWDLENDNALAGADARIAELDAATGELQAEVQRLQAENYKLLTTLAGDAIADADADQTEEAEETDYEEGSEPVDDPSEYFDEED